LLLLLVVAVLTLVPLLLLVPAVLPGQCYWQQRASCHAVLACYCHYHLLLLLVLSSLQHCHQRCC
jgi:hypothetical protein